MVCLEKIAKMPKILDVLKNDGKLPIFPPQHALKGTWWSMGVRHSTHFFMILAHDSQAIRWLHGLNRIWALFSEQTIQSSNWN